MKKMSESNNSDANTTIFKNKYQTEFVRVSQKEDLDGFDRHPGMPTSPIAQPRNSANNGMKTNATRQPSNDIGIVAHAQMYPGMAPVLAARSIPKQDNALACPVCKIDYDSVMKRPILLPGCGHTFCSICVRERSVPCLECPICKRSYPGASIDSLPINISLEALLVNKSGVATLERIVNDRRGGAESTGNCPSHGIRLSFLCKTCDEVACGECLFDKHPVDGHTLVKLQDVAEEIRTAAHSTITVCLDDATKIFSGCLKEFATLLERLHEAGDLMQESQKLVAAVSCAADFVSVSSVYDAIGKINSKVVELTLDAESAEDVDPVETSNADSPATKSPEINAPTSNANTAAQVFAMNTDGRLAEVKTEEHGLHVYSLAQYPTTGYSVAVRLGLLMNFIQRNDPIVFLDFSTGQQKIGRVYIRLRGEMKRSLQFLHLCLGTMGPCYRNSRVDGLSEKGVPGEYMRLGDYTGQGGQGGVGLIEGLEWGDKWTDTKKSGQVCGVGGDAGEKRFGALFVLCTRDNPKDHFRSPFGRVFLGMGTLYAITKMKNIEAVHISECGALIPIE